MKRIYGGAIALFLTTIACAETTAMPTVDVEQAVRLTYATFPTRPPAPTQAQAPADTPTAIPPTQQPADTAAPSIAPTATLPLGLFQLQPGKFSRMYTNEKHADTCSFRFNSGVALWNKFLPNPAFNCILNVIDIFVIQA